MKKNITHKIFDNKISHIILYAIKKFTMHLTLSFAFLFIFAFSINFTFDTFAEAGIVYMPTKAPEVSANNINSNVDPNSPSINKNTYDIEEDGPSEAYNVGEISTNNNYVDVFYGVELNDDFLCQDNNQLVRNGWRKINIYSFIYYGMPTEGFYHDYIWCYFNDKGKAIRANQGKFKKVKIDGVYYAFNEYCQMLEGFFNEDGEMYVDEGDNEPYDMLDDSDLYYAEPDTGALHKGWLSVPNNNDKYDRGTIWMYFSPSTYKAVHSKGSNYKTETIDGKTYAFDDKGVMLKGFEAYDYNVEQGGSTTNIKYFGDDGALTSGFVRAIPSENVDEDDYEDDMENTYYVNKSGKVYKDTIKKIGNHYYGFDTNGVVLTGLTVWKNGKYVASIETEDTSARDFILYGRYTTKDDTTRTFDKSTEVLHYFDNNGYRVTNSVKIEFSDDIYTYEGSNAGGYNGLKNKKFYQNGILMKATEDKFGIYILNVGSGSSTSPGSTGSISYNMSQICGNGNVYVLNKSGSKVTSSTGQDDDEDRYWLVSSSGTLLNIYSVPVKRSGSTYQFKSTPVGGGNDKWINFGEKDYYGRTCVLAYTANGTTLSNGAKAYYQTKPSGTVALNFILN